MKPLLFLLLASCAMASEKTDTLAPSPVNFKRATITYEKGKVEVKIPNRFQMYIQDEFTNMGWWTFILLGALFWVGVALLIRGDILGVLGVLITFLITFGLLAYAFYER